jgi:hypothetical protein
MSRYQWLTKKKSKDRALARQNYNRQTNGTLLPDIAHLQVRDAPVGDPNLWVPIGPSTVLRGQAGGKPRVTGRVRDLAVSDDGMRAYAATANGGVWYTSDAGSNWSPLGNWVATPGAATLNRAAQALTCGCVHVIFGVAADGSGDQVYVGTGELRPHAALQGDELGGVGVLHLTSPLATALADPFGSGYWKREAKNLIGAGIYRIKSHPTDPNTLVAATSIGLFTRTGAFTEDSDWTQIKADPFDFTPTDGKWTTDVVWAKGATPRLWVALLAGADTALYTSTAGPAGPFTFTRVDLEGALHNGRLGLCLVPADETILYVLGAGASLWQISGTTPATVSNIPEHLFMSAGDQSSYDLALGVHPVGTNTVIIGGATVQSDGQWSASLFKLTITGTAPNLSGGFVLANQPTDKMAKDGTYIGNGVHADVHQIKFVNTASGVHVWVGCDGGVFRSTDAGSQYSFVSRGAGLAVLQTGFIASHPNNDAFVVAGAQDNGTLVRIGDTVWMFSPSCGGDGGSVVIHPIKDSYYAAQYSGASWYGNGTISQPVFRTPTPNGTSPPNFELAEGAASMFYSAADVRQVGATNQVRLAVGTNRVWLADNWDPAPTPAAATAWVTLPSNRDPRAGTGRDTATDTYGDKSGKIIGCRWVDDNRLLVLVRSDQTDGENSAVLMMVRQANGTWQREEISAHHNKCSDFSNSDISNPSDYLPPLGLWSDLAVQDPTHGPNGSFYVACTGSVTVGKDAVVEADKMDTVWWYDGTSKWFATGLRTGASPPTKAPAYAVVCDPDDSTVVFVGTGLGVWRGKLTLTGNAPTWVWQKFSNGLPEAAVQDLSIYASAAKGPIKLLRAAIDARGIWELDISATPGPTRRIYVRVTANDSRRRAVSSLTNPMADGLFPTWSWFASPDIRIRPAPLTAGESAPPAPTALTWNGFAGNTYDLWVFQTALHKIDPVSKPNGEWNSGFTASLKRNNAAEGNKVTATRWAAVVTAANVYADPWDGAPTEADLVELVKERNQNGDVRAGPPAISQIQPRKHRVDVLVHYRDLRPVAKTDVKVTLLRRALPADQTQWPTIAISADWKTKLQQLVGGAAPAFADGWTVADTTSAGSAVAQPTADVDARMPRVVTFTVDFGGAASGSRFVLLAAVHAASDPLTPVSLVGDTLQDLVLKSHQVAVRVTQIL